jgi:N-methylhydantoinase B/oxoprolinase/acetone carboxylase alpha subunit
MTNTMNTPVEALETYYPLRVRRYASAAGPGGRGRTPAEMVSSARSSSSRPPQVTLLGERRRVPPWGLAGGGERACGRGLAAPGHGRGARLAAKTTLTVESGDRLRVETPGGGGFGTARPR